MAAIQQDKEATAKSRTHGELDQAPAGYESTESRSKRMLLGYVGMSQCLSTGYYLIDSI
jgi:hypothetical protein